MCGFLVQKKLSNNFKLNKKKFKIASKLIYHRGPDSKNYLYNESYAFQSQDVCNKMEIKSIKN